MLVNTLIKRRGCEAVVVCTCDASDPNRAPMMMMGGGDSLGCRVVQLVLSSPGEAALDAAVRPQPLDDPGQVVWQDALLLRRRRQGEQLAGVILAERQTWLRSPR